jgi:hypothetical protein
VAGDYEVGYGKPPRHGRFRPGRSGNPSGRPKGPQTLPADLRAELAEDVTLREGELERTCSKQRAILRSLTAKAIEGDPKATALVLDLVQRLLGTTPEPESEPEAGPRERLAARIAQVHERLAAAAPDESADTLSEGPGRGS